MDVTEYLYESLRKKRLSGVYEALKNGAAVDGKSKGLRTPLHIAAMFGSLEAVKVLISHGANVNPRSLLDKGMQPLHMAVKNGFVEVVRELIARGGDCDNRYGKGIHAVHLAAEMGHVEVLEVLKTQGCDLESQTRDGNTPLHLAALHDNFSVVKWLVEVGGVNTQSKNQDCLTPEDCAKQRNVAGKTADFLHGLKMEKERASEEKDSSNNAIQLQPCPAAPLPLPSPSTPQDIEPKPSKPSSGKRSKDKPCPLVLGLGGNETEGADGDGEKETGILHQLFSPLLSPSGSGKSLGGSGSDNSDLDLNVREDIVSAVTRGSYADVDRLLSLGVSTEVCSQQEGEKGLRLLHLAAWNGHRHIVRLLLQQRANRRSKAHGLLAVHWGAIGGHVGVLEELWNQGLSIKARADDGSTPLHFAADHGNMEAVTWLTEKGAFLQVKDKKGRTPRNLAMDAGNQAIVAILKEKENELRMGNMSEVKKLGEGSFGEVFLMKKGSKHVVVKQIDLSQLTRRQQEYAHAEIKVLKSLSHPNIVSYKGGGFETRYLYIHMEYCSGGDLATLISNQKEKGHFFEEQQVYVCTLRLCFALKYIHRRKILHRDIKPLNIFLDESGVVKLGDFGLVRVLNEDSAMANTVLGTVAYMSPEVMNGTPYNDKSDMWSFGCSLYELATLERPQLFMQVKEVAGPWSNEFKQVVLSLLNVEPIRRPSAEDLLKETFLIDTMESLLEASEQDVKALSKDVQDLTEELTETSRELEGIRGKKT